MLLELIFTVILNNITNAHTHTRTYKIPSPRAPVGAKNKKYSLYLGLDFAIHRFFLLENIVKLDNRL